METKPERLQKILAAAGLASRRKAEELIAAGLVSVNGHTVTEPGTKADPRLDEIRVDGKLLRGPERHVYLAMYKPKGHMTTVSDPEGRPTVMDLLKGVEERVFPVGRLDYMSEGLLLLTNDGDLMAQLTRAGSHVAKTYMVKVSGKPAEEEIDKLRNGIMLPPEPGLTGVRGKKQPGTERRSFAMLTQPARHPACRGPGKSLVRGDPHRRTQSPDPPHVRADRLPHREDQARPLRLAHPRS